MQGKAALVGDFPNGEARARWSKSWSKGPGVAGPEPWVPSKHGGNQGLTPGHPESLHQAIQNCRRVGDSSAGVSPSGPDRLQLQRVEGHEQVGKQPTKYPVLTKCGKSRGRNKQGGSVGSQAGRQAVWLLSEPKFQVLSYLLVKLMYLEYMHESGESNPPFLFS